MRRISPRRSWSRVKTINFGAKEGVQAVTIVYPIDFLPAGVKPKVGA